MTVRRTLFANFVSNNQRKAGGITNLSPNPFWVSSDSGLAGISFINANRVWLDPLTADNDGDAFEVIRDTDGSVTGVVSSRIVPANPLMVTTSCLWHPEWNAYTCPNNYASVQIATAASEDQSGTVVTRNDGANYILSSRNSGPGNLHMNLLPNRPYSLRLPGATPKSISFIRYEQKGLGVRLSLPYPNTFFTVTLWGSAVTNATSLDDLALAAANTSTMRKSNSYIYVWSPMMVVGRNTL